MSTAAISGWAPWTFFEPAGNRTESKRPAFKATLAEATLPATAATPTDAKRPMPAATATAPAAQDAADWSPMVTRCLRGDTMAWTELVRAHHGRVFALCYRFTGSSHDAEDLTQEVFLKVWSNLRSFDPLRGAFPTWLTTMTRNMLVDHFRRTKGQRKTDSLDQNWDDPNETAQTPALTLTDSRRSPHEQAVSSELARQVQAALTKVSPELREAVILRDLQDLDYKEIAAVLRIPEGTVKSRISRGRAELARLLQTKREEIS